MILSPVQQDYVTRKEFNEFEIRFDKHEQYVKDGFEKVFEQLDVSETNSIRGFKRVDEEFKKVHERFEIVDQRFDRMEKRLDSIQSQIGLLTNITNKIADKILD
jgi:hypothetical protein